ncbi:MAG: hypothetical protein WCM76_16275 [Bacteroidota bacterium]
MIKTLTQHMHVHLFEELIQGRYRPFLPKYSDNSNLQNIILEAQTRTVSVLIKGQDVDEFIAETDFLSFGFKDESDFDIIKKSVPGGKTEISVVPMKAYAGREVLDIPSFTSFKTNIFLELIMDEFERLKIRAEKKFEQTVDRKELTVYAEKHIVKTKLLLYDAKLHLNDNHSRDDIYILLALSMVLINTILFYQKLFKPFLSITPETREQLKSELFSSIALGRLKALFDMRGSEYCTFIKKSYLGKPCSDDCNTADTNENGAETFSEKKSSQQEQGSPKFYPGVWNGQINVLMDIFIQITEEIKVSDKPLFDTSPENLRAIIMEVFLDKYGKRLSYHTVNTNLKSYRTDKRIKANSPKKINIKDILTRPGKE